MAGTVRKLSFSEGVNVGAPTDLAISSATAGAYADDAAYVADKGAAVDGSYYVNTTTDVLKYYSGAAWRTALTNALADGKLLVGNGSGVATAVTPTGDVTITNAGVTAIGAAKVTNTMLAGSIALGKLATITAFRVLGAAADGVLSEREVDGDINVPVWSSGKLTLRIVAGTITNTMVSASAAIAGTKISPAFGSQNVSTTGTLAAGPTVITGSTSSSDQLVLTRTGSSAGSCYVGTGSADFRVGTTAGATDMIHVTAAGLVAAGTGFKGRTSASSVAAGSIGERLVGGITSGTMTTAGTVYNLAAQAITAGTWLIICEYTANPPNGAVMNTLNVGIDDATAVFNNTTINGDTYGLAAAPGLAAASPYIQITKHRYLVTSTGQTVYFNASSNASSVTIYARYHCLRIA